MFTSTSVQATYDCLGMLRAKNEKKRKKLDANPTFGNVYVNISANRAVQL
jgi:hypothetical protein